MSSRGRRSAATAVPAISELLLTPDLRSHEARTLQFRATVTMIPVPKIHDVHYDGNSVVAIVMDYIQASHLVKYGTTRIRNSLLRKNSILI